MSDPARLKQLATEHVEVHRGELLRVSHTLAERPEVAWQEHESAALLAGALEAAGFVVRRGVAGLPTAFHATAGTGATHVAMVAEYDALPGLGHACGHNIIASAALGAAVGLGRLLAELGITLHVIGTPAEEGGGGKILMLDAGEFEGLHAAMMIHPGPEDSLYAHPFAVAHWRVTYTGKATHAAAYPQLGVNAADAFTVAQVAIGLMRQQLPSDTRVHGIVVEAGTAANAIPERAVGNWYVRATNLEDLDALCARVRACFEAGALATGCTLTVEETSPRYADFRTDEDLARLFAENARARGRDMLHAGAGASGMNTASTDMGNVSQVVRAIHPYIGIQSGDAVNHQGAFAAAAVTPAADAALLDAAVILAHTAIDFALAQRG